MPLVPVRGVVGTPVTPFTPDNRVDQKALEKVVRFLLDSEVAAIALPMHIGESLNLDSAERRQVAEVAAAVISGGVPLIVNVSMAGTDQAIELTRHAARIGAAAVIAVTPYHWQPPREALFQHYESLALAAPVGVIAYNYPSRLGVEVSLELLEDLIQGVDNFVGLKDAGLSMEYFTEVCRLAAQLRPDFSTYTGVEYLLPSMIVGGAGAFSALGAVAPRLVRGLHQACASADYGLALELQRRASRLWRLLQPSYPATVKAAMEILGRPAGATRRPVPPLSQEARGRLARTLGEWGILDSEPIGWNARVGQP